MIGGAKNDFSYLSFSLSISLSLTLSLSHTHPHPHTHTHKQTNTHMRNFALSDMIENQILGSNPLYFRVNASSPLSKLFNLSGCSNQKFRFTDGYTRKNLKIYRSVPALKTPCLKFNNTTPGANAIKKCTTSLGIPYLGV